MEEDEGISSVHSFFTNGGDGKAEDERKGQSCLADAGRVLSKQRNIEESEGELGSSMISGFTKFLQV